MTAQAADNLPLYGVCCYVEEMVHRPPPMLASQFPEHTKPLSRMLVAAPRCYAFLTNFPFFSLHMKVHAGICLVYLSESSPAVSLLLRNVGHTVSAHLSRVSTSNLRSLSMCWCQWRAIRHLLLVQILYQSIAICLVQQSVMWAYEVLANSNPM